MFIWLIDHFSVRKQILFGQIFPHIHVELDCLFFRGETNVIEKSIASPKYQIYCGNNLQPVKFCFNIA